MYYFSSRSESNLITCHPELIFVAREAIRVYDFAVIDGHRDEAKQNGYFLEGVSRKRWPESAHNSDPSDAMDLVPCPMIQNGVSIWDEKSKVRFFFLAGVIFQIARVNGINIRWGRDWDRDLDFFDQKFNDLPHFERIAAI